MTTTAQVAHRKLRGKVDAFVDARDDPAIVGHYDKRGDAIGAYRNPRGTDPELVLITDQAIYYLDGSGRHEIRFGDIEDVDLPPTVDSPRELQIRRAGGDAVTLRIEGRTGKVDDVYRMYQFLIQAAEVARSG